MKDGYLELDDYCYKTNRLSVFEKYKKSDDPQVRERAETWGCAIGLQAVDGLTVSDYLIGLACKNIEGKITSEEVDELLSRHSEEKRKHKNALNEYETYIRVDSVDPIESKMGRPI